MVMDIPHLYVFTSTHLYFHYILYISIDIYMEPHKDIYTYPNADGDYANKR
jgi:hypothetical protein